MSGQAGVDLAWSRAFHRRPLTRTHFRHASAIRFGGTMQPICTSYRTRCFRWRCVISVTG